MTPTSYSDTELPPSARSVYIHVPFCGRRCGYCNFTLIAGRDDLIPAYLDALDGEMAARLEAPIEVDTIFLGGGTPSHLAPGALRTLLERVGRWLKLAPGGEYSCEANPLDCDDDRLELLRGHGVNRLSLGGQSFNDEKLRRLERDHDGRALSAALDRAASYFPRVSLDLIFAAPAETLSVWREDIARAQSSPIGHLSTYGLTIERGSAFYGQALRARIVELEQESQLAMYAHAIDALVARGWEHYEVSNFALTGQVCRHNESYWLGRPWWGFGPGAASFLFDDRRRATRRVNHRGTIAYIRRQLAGQEVAVESETLTREDRVRERLVFGLRRLAGVTWRELEAAWGSPARPLFEPWITRYLERGWLEQTGDSLRLTREGLYVSDGLWPDLLASSSSDA